MNSLPPICTFFSGSLHYRGQDVCDLIGRNTFVETLVLLLTGSLPLVPDPRCSMIDALLLAWADHGEPPPSTQAVMHAAAVGAPLIQAAISGFSMFGWDHAPVDAAACLLADWPMDGVTTMMREVMASGEKLPGFGHPVHQADPRARALLHLGKELAITATATDLLQAIEAEFGIHGKNVKSNLAGATAALWLDMGFRRESVGLIALVGRSVGLAAHHSEVVRRGTKFIGTP